MHVYPLSSVLKTCSVCVCRLDRIIGSEVVLGDITRYCAITFDLNRCVQFIYQMLSVYVHYVNAVFIFFFTHNKQYRVCRLNVSWNPVLLCIFHMQIISLWWRRSIWGNYSYLYMLKLMDRWMNKLLSNNIRIYITVSRLQSNMTHPAVLFFFLLRSTTTEISNDFDRYFIHPPGEIHIRFKVLLLLMYYYIICLTESLTVGLKKRKLLSLF